MVSKPTQQTLGTAWTMVVVGISTLLIILASSSDGAVWGMLGVVVGTGCALLGLYAGQNGNGDPARACQS
jgi:hypothetical protein